MGSLGKNSDIYKLKRATNIWEHDRPIEVSSLCLVDLKPSDNPPKRERLIQWVWHSTGLGPLRGVFQVSGLVANLGYVKPEVVVHLIIEEPEVST